MSKVIYIPKSQQQIMPLFDGKFIENKPISFPDKGKSNAYSNLFYWAHLEALQTAEFPLHPHKGFEIMTFVLKGSLEHFDTATKVWTPLSAGGVQVIQAGSGVEHAERITEGSELFQIWFDPDMSKTLKESAQYKDYQINMFQAEKQNGIETIVYVGKNGPITHKTEGISIKKIGFNEGEYHFDLNNTITYSLYLLNGSLVLNNQEMGKDGFVILHDTDSLSIMAQEGAELFMIESPAEINYRRYID